MGSIVFNFLSESFLFDDTCREEAYGSIPDADLVKELRQYRQHVLSNLDALRQETNRADGQLKLLADQDYFSIERLKQSALYLDQLILPDPLFQLSREASDTEDTLNRFLGMPQNKEIDRGKLAEAASKMKNLTPMVLADYVKFFPMSYFLEPNEGIPVIYSKTGFADVLPEPIISKYRENAEVRSLSKTERGLIVENTLQPGRSIGVCFRGDHEMMAYDLVDQEIVETNYETRTASFQLKVPNEPPSVEVFEAWVAQSVNQSARVHFKQLLEMFRLSNILGSSYLTGSEFTHSLLGSNDPRQSVEHHTADCVLNLDFPCIENISMHELMRVRAHDGEAFRLFRRELERRFRALRTETDPEILKIKAENAVHELSGVQVEEIRQKIRSLQKTALADIVVAAVGLSATVLTSGLSIAATAMALANGMRSYSEYRKQVRENPSFFLWKAGYEK